MDIKETLKNSTKDLLTPEALTEIETVFSEAVNAKASLQVEVALAKQDEDHAGKVSKLLEAVDTDHTKKLEKIVDAINENHATKLKAIVKKFDTSTTSAAQEFKTTLVESISNYLDLYLDEMMPEKAIQEAVANKRAVSMLAEVKKYLAVTEALGKDSIRDAIKDGKTQLDEANKKIAALTEANKKFADTLSKNKTSNILESLSKDFTDEKKKFVVRVLSDKTPEFVNENFKYTSDLFDKEKESIVEQLKTEAIKNVKGNIDPVIEEKVIVKPEAPTADPALTRYMSELGKY